MNLRSLARIVRQFRSVRRGEALASALPPPVERENQGAHASNDLKRFFDSRLEGPGIWKWEHYFEIYDRHLKRFRGTSPTILEIGVYSGGSLDMWLEYFGPGTRIIGVDIEESCLAYQRDGVEIVIGDQADRTFWRDFKSYFPKVDIIIDDGGHQAHQQIITMEEMLPHLADGGVFICEDVHGANHPFSDAVYGLAKSLNSADGVVADFENPERRLAVPSTRAQASIASVCFYPYVVAIERRALAIGELRAPKHGSSWEPFLR